VIYYSWRDGAVFAQVGFGAWPFAAAAAHTWDGASRAGGWGPGTVFSTPQPPSKKARKI
jgi:hypothetical protein